VTAIAFMVMPFGRKSTKPTGGDAPAEVDFDALWHNVHKPVLTRLGYQAVRADSDTGALIIVEMIQRLALADVVLADISIGNSNVYYEVGVRHAARDKGCVLVAADWATPVFDLGQIRRRTYPLPDGGCGDEAAAAARTVLLESLPAMFDGLSPVFQAVPGYPGLDRARVVGFTQAVDELSGFDADVVAIRLAADPGSREQLTRGLVERYGSRPVIVESAVLELISLIRDHLGWTEVLAYIDTLPDPVREEAAVVEQRSLALAKTGEVLQSAAALEQLVRARGGTSERLGLLGGRYKQLMRRAGDPTARRRYLERAIDAYERGMVLDLNDYYPAGNLPRLYRTRAGEGDEKRAAETAVVAMTACRASIERHPQDPWVRPALVGAAFDAGDVEEAARLLDRITVDGFAQWQLETTVDDLRDSIRLHEDPVVRSELSRILRSLRLLIDDAAQVVVVSGHMVDDPARRTERFPERAVPDVTRAIRDLFEVEWSVGDGTTLVTGGARGADLIAAEEAVRLGAHVVMCLALPAEEFERRSVAQPGTDWGERFRSMLGHAEVRHAWSESGVDAAGDDVFAVANESMVRYAKGLAARPHAVLVWDGGSGDGPGGTADIVSRLGYDRGDERLVVIDPLHPR
jgi:hypothetical protein